MFFSFSGLPTLLDLSFTWVDLASLSRSLIKSIFLGFSGIFGFSPLHWLFLVGEFITILETFLTRSSPPGQLVSVSSLIFITWMWSLDWRDLKKINLSDPIQAKTICYLHNNMMRSVPSLSLRCNVCSIPTLFTDHDYHVAFQHSAQTVIILLSTDIESPCINSAIVIR